LLVTIVNAADFVWLYFFGRAIYHVVKGNGWKRALF
jgi:hypothetical protein